MRRSRFLTTAAASTALGAARPAAAQFTQPSLNFAVVGPFTGDQAAIGEQLANGVRAALDDANTTRSAFDRIFAMRTIDDQGQAGFAFSASRQACDDLSIAGVIGHAGGRATDAATQQYAIANLPLAVPITTYDPITAHGYRNIFRLPTKDSQEGALGAQFAVAQTPRPANAVVVSLDADYGPDVARGFAQRADTEKLRVRAVTLAKDNPDFAGAARSIAADPPGTVYLAATVRDLGPLVRELRRAGYRGPLQASQGFFDAATIRQYGDDVAGMIVSTSMPPLALAPSARRIVADFERQYGGFSPVSAFGYAAAQLFVAAVRRGGVTERIGLLRALSIPIPIDTVVGPFTYLGTGDPSDPNVYFYTVKSGSWVYQRPAHPTTFLAK